jgi:hypothetical protein
VLRLPYAPCRMNLVFIHDEIAHHLSDTSIFFRPRYGVMKEASVTSNLVLVASKFRFLPCSSTHPTTQPDAMLNIALKGIP